MFEIEQARSASADQASRQATQGREGVSHEAARSGPRGGEIDQWAGALAKLLERFGGVMAIRLHDGSTGVFGRDADLGHAPRFTLGLRNPDVLRTLLLGRDPLRFAELYFRGDVDVDGDLFCALSLKDHLHALRLPLADRLLLLLRVASTGTLAPRHAARELAAAVPRGSPVRSHLKEENRQAIAFHYDLSNDFYALWLGETMVYSCAYFESDEFSLEQAQQAKLDHICRKLRLVAGDRLLDIGCGWGALVMHAARHYGVQAHGVTLSERQFELATQRVKEAGLQDRVTLALQDYRDIEGRHCFDKVASVGMFEHVGLKNLPVYFNTVLRLLKPDGEFLNHGITHDEDGWGEALSSRFINRYVFPDGELDTVSNILQVMEQSGFEIVDVEGLRRHYAKTLRHWVQRLEAQRGRALEYVNEATYRVWRLYMAASALEFESSELGVYQILATPQGRHSSALAANRRYIYP